MHCGHLHKVIQSLKTPMIPLRSYYQYIKMQLSVCWEEEGCLLALTPLPLRLWLVNAY